jgi:hypothetical protein
MELVGWLVSQSVSQLVKCSVSDTNRRKSYKSLVRTLWRMENALLQFQSDILCVDEHICSLELVSDSL